MHKEIECTITGGRIYWTTNDSSTERRETIISCVTADVKRNAVWAPTAGLGT